jgi:hypothetical protein
MAGVAGRRHAVMSLRGWLQSCALLGGLGLCRLDGQFGRIGGLGRTRAPLLLRILARFSGGLFLLFRVTIIRLSHLILQTLILCA